MNGLLIIDKPAGMTSHDVVARCRRILKTKKIGHTGTLDPFATGVMVILVGKATRLAQFLDKDEKEYEAVVRFGFETTTGDLTGELRVGEVEKGGERASGGVGEGEKGGERASGGVGEAEKGGAGEERVGERASGGVGEAEKGGVGEGEKGGAGEERVGERASGGVGDSSAVTPSPLRPFTPSPLRPLSPSPTHPFPNSPVPPRAKLERALGELTGTIEQIPPMYSAKKIDGTKLYELARKGIEVERKAVTVTIRELELVEDSDLLETDRRLRVVCSAGTYIRTLAEDLARKADSRAHLAALRRTRAGKFGIESAVTLEEFESISDEGRIGETMIPMIDALEHLPDIRLNADRVAKTRNGLTSRIGSNEIADGAVVRMVDETGDLIAIGSFDAVNGEVKPRIVLV